jgi:hypothetical protein
MKLPTPRAQGISSGIPPKPTILRSTSYGMVLLVFIPAARPQGIRRRRINKGRICNLKELFHTSRLKVFYSRQSCFAFAIPPDKIERRSPRTRNNQGQPSSANC